MASAVAFISGGMLPMLALPLRDGVRVGVTVIIALVAFAAAGALGAWLGGPRPGRSTLRVLLGGALALAVTFAIGTLLGTPMS